MDEYIQKYLDGDLSDAEAAMFASALARDPVLEAQLRELEEMLAAADAGTERDLSPSFSDHVMERVFAEEGSRGEAIEPSPTLFERFTGGPRTWVPRLAWVASFALVFSLGYMVAGRGPSDIAVPTSRPAIETSASRMAAPVRLARLVYVPRNPDVEQVSVAGTFNGWDPAATAMERQGQSWVVLMTLPPEVYEYMFVEDGQNWVTDPLATETRDDGFGRENAVLDLTM